MDITFCTGLMGAGKSKRLIEEYRNDQREKIALAVSLIEETGSKGIIESRNGDKISAIYLNKDQHKENIELIEDFVFTNDDIDVIYIDESQFLPKKTIIELIDFSDCFNVTIHFFGLDLTFTGEYFESSKYLLETLPYEKIYRINRKCDITDCENLAQYNARIVNGEIVRTGEIFVQEKSLYLALCEHHFFTKDSIFSLE
jgi:thymidine kinase